MFGRSSSGTVEERGERRRKEEEERGGGGREGVDESYDKPFACFDFMFDEVYQPCIVNWGSNVHTHRMF